ncbi:MAG: PQQ-dependent sugar dehydrogenase [Acidimicrobiia bacterium]
MRILVVGLAVFVAVTGLIDWVGRQAVDELPCHDGAEPIDASPTIDGELLDLTAHEVALELDQPSDLFTLPGLNGLFVVEKPGRVVKVENGEMTGTPVLDMTALVTDESNEQGLISAKPDPDFPANCLVYLFYTDSYGDSQLVSARVSGTEQPSIDPRTFEHLLEIPQKHRWHQSGAMTFGPDGHLWLAIGDGGGIGDPQGNGQNPHTLKGTLLRIDVGESSVGVPPNNPFVKSGEGRGEVWAFGLRNPWRVSVDGESGLVYIPDVGQETTEELNIVEITDGGINFGWPITEGSGCFESDECDTEGFAMPVYEYGHDGVGCAIVGGQVYRGKAIPEMEGHYFFSDYCSGWVRSFEYRDGAISSEREWPSLKVTRLVTSFGTDQDGELYILSLDGGLWRIAPVREGA